MKPFDLAEIRECVAHGNRAAALSALRAAIAQQKIVARDGVELMLAVRQGSPDVVADAVEAMEWGLPGAYRFVPKAAHDFD
jgi:hypothetical protein